MTNKPHLSRRSPQEKKKLSYERDRVNVYGQNDKASRKRIPKFKAQSNRNYRRAATELVRKIAQTNDEEPRFEGRLADARFTRSDRGKARDLPIGVTLDKRPLTRIAGADRAPTRNVRESLLAAMVRRSEYEQRSMGRWLRKGIDEE
jgi:hypothetical protein